MLAIQWCFLLACLLVLSYVRIDEVAKLEGVSICEKERTSDGENSAIRTLHSFWEFCQMGGI